MTFTLVDSPLTPYSNPDEIRAWVIECGLMAEKNPDDSGWRDALNEAKELARTAEVKASEPA